MTSTISRMIVLTIAAEMFLTATVVRGQTTWHVDADTSGPTHDGSSWCSAYLTLQDALAAAGAGGTIKVADGTYMPDGGYQPVGGDHVPGTHDRTATFQLINGVEIYGGYAGCGAPDPDERDIEVYETILSGDLDGDDVEDLVGFLACFSGDDVPYDPGCAVFDLDGDGDVDALDGNIDENSHHVVTGSETDVTAVLDGFTIISGHAHADADAGCNGGGMYNYMGSPTVANCTFNGNKAYWYGGGIYNWDCSPNVSHCTFSGNRAYRGGGMYNKGESSPALDNSLFSGNSAGYGGGMYNHFSSPEVANCTFSRNAASVGGGMYNYMGSPTVTNCIFWGDTGGEIYNAAGMVTVHYSDVQGGYSGTGNIDEDPRFVDPDGPDNISGTADDNLRLLAGSHCIDAGDNTAISELEDLDGNPRRVDDVVTSDTGNGTPPIVDMGAYEYWPIYVDADAVGWPRDGSSWYRAYETLQDALAAAPAGSTMIKVADGIYKPDQGGGQTPGDPEATFQLISGVTMEGGYAGCGATDPNERNIELYETILSGDLDGDDVEDCVSFLSCFSGDGVPYVPGCATFDSDEDGDVDALDGNIDDNSYHVVTGSGADATAVLDGFTVTGGNANGSYPDSCGGGMLSDHGSPTVANCTFTRNLASDGGGIYGNDESNSTLANCTFSGNRATGDGGGMYNDSSNPKVNRCTVGSNMAMLGGGMYNYLSSPNVTNCAFSRNTSDDGGGMHNESSNPDVINCVFTGNRATEDGGGMCNDSSSPTVTNCTFSGNTAGRGGGMCNDSSSPKVTNCIFWGDTDSEIYDVASASDVTYSDVMDDEPDDGNVYTGTGNIDKDPRFVDPDGPDNMTGTEDDNLRLSPGSPCIDAGNNNAMPLAYDLDGNPRFVDDGETTDTGNGEAPIVDMGAYEYCAIYVDANANGSTENGLSWCSAYLTLQDALDALAEHPDGCPIRVADGTYMPDGGYIPVGGQHFAGTRDQAATFQLVSGLTIEGGYAGCGAADPNERNIELYETILSGDLDGDDVEDLVGFLRCFSGDGADYDPGCAAFDSDGDGDVDALDGNINENSYHVVRGSGTDTTAVLDGFTITSGHAHAEAPDDHPERARRGGGMYTNTGNPTVINCGFTGNSAGYGGGMYNRESSPTVTSCIFTGNAAGAGGAMYNTDESSPTVADCTFRGDLVSSSYPIDTMLRGGLSGNDDPSGFPTGPTSFDNSYQVVTGDGMNCTAVLDGFIIAAQSTGAGYGGGMYNRESSPTVSNCVFSRNSAEHCGGGMYGSYGSPWVTNSTFIGNSAGNGGGMYNSFSSPWVTNCMFSGNRSSDGGGIYNHASDPTVTNCTISENTACDNGGGVRNYYSNPTLTNCILWNNTGGEIYDSDNSDPVVTYSDVQGGYPGTGNIDEDPRFVDPDGPDNIPATQDENLRLSPGSPCIDAGNNNAVPRDAADLNLNGDTDEPTPYDLDGSPRFADDTATSDCPQPGADCGVPPIVDMGAYEYWRTIYVDANATGPTHDGRSWCSAYLTLQDALAVAVAGFTAIRVADGTYMPDGGYIPLSGQHVAGTKDPTATFQLISGVTIEGGYAGCGATDPDKRDIEAYETILSGDLEDDDGPIRLGWFADCFSGPGAPPELWCRRFDFDSDNDVDGDDLPPFLDVNNYGENSFHVVTGSGTDATAVLDGLTITSGHAHADEPEKDHQGGGMYTDIGSPTVANCTFTANSAGSGGGMYNDYSSPTVDNCTFIGNLATLRGGGMRNNYESSPQVTHCMFIENTAYRGGGMYSDSSSPTVTNCTFIGNTATSRGGGMHYGVYGSPTVTNCTFTENTATDGGGMCNDGNPTLTNCTFTGNAATNGGGIYIWSGSPTVTNCILWEDTGGEINDDHGTPVVTYSDVQDDVPNDGNVYPGTGNIDTDPVFFGGNDYRLLKASPCVDSGTNDVDIDASTPQIDPLPATDLDGNPRIVDGDNDGTPIVDMGTYEFGSIDCEDLQPSPPREERLDLPDEPINIKMRALSFYAGDLGRKQAIRVTFESLPAPYNGWNGLQMWVGPPTTFCENSGFGLPSTAPGQVCPPAGTGLPIEFAASTLQCDPYFYDWAQGYCLGGPDEGDECSVNIDCPGLGTCVDNVCDGGTNHGGFCDPNAQCAGHTCSNGVVHVFHEGVIPSRCVLVVNPDPPPAYITEWTYAEYSIEVMEPGCLPTSEDRWSDPLEMETSRWGDLVGDLSTEPPGPPDGTVSLAHDVTAMVDKFANKAGCVTSMRADVYPFVLDHRIGMASDVTFVLTAFEGGYYPPVAYGTPSGPPCGYVP